MQATSVTYSASAGDEIEITSLASSVITDPSNTNRKYVRRQYDTCFAGEAAEVTVEFFASHGANLMSLVGHARPLSVAIPDTEEGGTITTVSSGTLADVNQRHSFATTAILASLQLTATTGEYVRGSATFRLTG